MRERDFNRGRSTVRRTYGAIADLASTACEAAACPASRPGAVSAVLRRSVGVARAGRAHDDAEVGQPRTAERPGVVAERGGGRSRVDGVALAEGRAPCAVPRLAAARVDGGRRGPACVAHRRLASVGASLGARAIAGDASAGSGSACRRMPLGRLVYQP
jgi:hypothetical protein